MLLLTIVTGLVDAVAYLRLGHVFVANMTGNVVFLGFSAAGAPGLSVVGSLVAIACFLPAACSPGAWPPAAVAGACASCGRPPGSQLVLFAGAILVAAPAGDTIGSDSRYALIVLLALAMGVQNATARRLAVPDLTTTVLTLTLTGIAADSKLAGGSGAHTPDAFSRWPRCCSARPSGRSSCSRSTTPHRLHWRPRCWRRSPSSPTAHLGRCPRDTRRRHFSG